LTFPIVVLESGTAQNDLLAAAFFVACVWLTISGIRGSNRIRLLFAGLSLGLAVGTKQYVLYALPGLLLIGLYLLLNKGILAKWQGVKTWLISAAIFSLLVGSYAYLQNFINYGNFFLKDETNILTPTGQRTCRPSSSTTPHGWPLSLSHVMGYPSPNSRSVWL
jgi:4-amino-4-deoxy-L-arabinose transferase-like glycosyltransferase